MENIEQTKQLAISCNNLFNDYGVNGIIQILELLSVTDLPLCARLVEYSKNSFEFEIIYTGIRVCNRFFTLEKEMTFKQVYEQIVSHFGERIHKGANHTFGQGYGLLDFFENSFLETSSNASGDNWIYKEAGERFRKPVDVDSKSSKVK